MAAHLTANALRADVSLLASDALEGRGTPSPGLDIAAEFIAAEFRRAGLEPAGNDGYFQTADYARVTPNPEGLELSLETDGNTVKVDAASVTVLVAGGVDLRQAPSVRVSLGDAASLEALTPERMKGKVLILEGGEGGRARSIPVLAGRLQPALVVVLGAGGRGMNNAPRLQEARPAPAPVPTVAVAEGAVRRAIGEGTLVTVHLAAPTVTPVKLRNVVGVLRGSDEALKDTYVMLTAHYDHLGVLGTGPGDHIYNGANDDASGTASVIEIAGALAALPTRPKRSIVFIALFGEELGLLGSRYYAAHPVFPLGRTVADLNLEQVGRTDIDSGARVGILNVTGYDYTSMTDDLRKAGEETGVRVMKDAEATDAYYARSDNQAFADAGVPSHTLSVGYMFPDYHGVGDEWPKLDYDNMAKVDWTVALALYRVADSREAPAWNTANAKTKRYVEARGK
jgi:hypothetical protein